MIETCGREKFVGWQGDAISKWNTLPTPRKSVLTQNSRGRYVGKTWIIRRGIEVAADHTAYGPEFAVSTIHIAYMSCELLHRFFTNGNVLGDFTAVTFEM